MRLTVKNELPYTNGYDMIHDYKDCKNYQEREIVWNKDLANIVDKLGQLEDIEEELGIDLITLFKVLNNKIHTRLETEHYVGFDLIEQDSKGDYLFNLIDGNYYFKDYGKTWALTKEELE